MDWILDNPNPKNNSNICIMFIIQIHIFYKNNLDWILNSNLYFYIKK